MIKWEYRKDTGSLSEEDLDQLGQEGWELVTILTHTYKYSSDTHVFIFKRRYRKRTDA